LPSQNGLSICCIHDPVAILSAGAAPAHRHHIVIAGNGR
jgi:hypothetical protein